MARLLNAPRGPRAWLELEEEPAGLTLRLHGALRALGEDAAPAAGACLTLVADTGPDGPRIAVPGLRVAACDLAAGLLLFERLPHPAPPPLGPGWRAARDLAAAWRHAPMRVALAPGGRLVLSAAWWDAPVPVLVFAPNTHATLANAVAGAAKFHAWTHGAGDAALLAHTRPFTWAPPERLAAAGRQLPFASDLGAAREAPNAAARLLVLNKAMRAAARRAADEVALQLRPPQHLHVVDCWSLLRALFEGSVWSIRADEHGAVMRAGGPWTLNFGEETAAELSADQQTLTWTRAREPAFAWEQAALAEVAPLHNHILRLGRFRRGSSGAWELLLDRVPQEPLVLLRAVPQHHGMVGLARISLLPAAADFLTDAELAAAWLPPAPAALLASGSPILAAVTHAGLLLSPAPDAPWRADAGARAGRPGGILLARALPWAANLPPPAPRCSWACGGARLVPDATGPVTVSLAPDRTELYLSVAPPSGPLAWALTHEVFVLPTPGLGLAFEPAVTPHLVVRHQGPAPGTVAEARLHVPVGTSPEAEAWVAALSRAYDQARARFLFPL